MKKIIMATALVGLLNTTVYALEVSTQQSTTIPQSKRTKVELIEAKIQKYRRYLQQLPVDIRETLVELGEYRDKGNDAESMTRNLLKTLNDCATNELDEMAAEACSDITQDSVSDTIKKYKLEIKDMIKMVDAKLVKLRKNKKNTPIIEGAIKALEDSRDILKGKK